MKQLVLAYINFFTITDCIYNNYGEEEDLHKIWDEARAIFISFYDALIAHQELLREDSVEGVPVIGEGQDSNTAVIKEAIIDVHSAHMEFAKLQPK